MGNWLHMTKYDINAAVEIRLHQVDEYTERYHNKASTSKTLYTTLISHAIGLSDSVTGILPMHDMLNHSTDPNLAFSFCNGNFELVALRDISSDEELLLLYVGVFHKEGEWDGDNATWLLVQWGILLLPLQKKNQ